MQNNKPLNPTYLLSATADFLKSNPVAIVALILPWVFISAISAGLIWTFDMGINGLIFDTYVKFGRVEIPFLVIFPLVCLLWDVCVVLAIRSEIRRLSKYAKQP